MKPGEKMAYEYFQSKGYTDILYEPNRNSPPDFLIDGTIAVEVTRLSQFVKGENGLERLEDLEFDLMTRFSALLRSYENIKTGKCCFVSLNYKRPMQLDKTLMKDIKAILDSHLAFIEDDVEHQVRKNLTLRFRATRSTFKKPFTLGSWSDGDGGGLVVSNIVKSLEIIIPQKETKIQALKNTYSTWWLALNDRIGWGPDEMDINQLKQAFRIPTCFERLIFISPIDSSIGTEMSVK